ncbi:MAG: hypothetical protein MUP70_16330 [Candidatus Aminicenantes bacterium]|nr:hypothetical protein [Candidatus Aminicenantes bacterium]
MWSPLWRELLMKNAIKQYVILTRHFFDRLFQNDVIAFGDQARERVFGITAMLASLLGLASFMILSQYEWIEDVGQSWREKTYMIAFFMVIMGFIALIEWDAIFPDRRDIKNLSPLPVRTITIFNAKFTSLFLFAGMFSLGMNLFATFTFWLYLPKWILNDVLFGLYFVLVHLLTTFAALLFSLFFFNVVAGILLTLFRSRMYERISTAVRFMFLLAFVLQIFAFSRGVFYGIDWLLKVVENWKTADSLLLYLFPPMWFTGLYETLLGSPDPQYHTLALIAGVSLAVLFILFYATAGLSYRRHLGVHTEAVSRKRSWNPFSVLTDRIFLRLFLRHPVERAVYDFYGKTLRSSMYHKIRLTTYISVGIGLVLIFLVSQNIGSNVLFSVNRTMLSMPIVLAFFMLLGIRKGVDMPVDLESNWIFRLTEYSDRRRYHAGFQKAVLFQNLIPLYAVLSLLFLLIWDFGTAVAHLLFCMALSILMMAGIFFRRVKIPFTCSYMPGKEKLQFYWFFYFVGYVLTLAVINSIEVKALESPVRIVLFVVLFMIGAAALYIYQSRTFYPKTAIKYEEEEDTTLIGLDYQTPAYKNIDI